MSKSVQVFNGGGWDHEVLGQPGVVLVDFWAEWCPPCRKLGPVIEALAGEYEGRARVGKLDVDENPDIAGRYNVTSIPTLLLFRDGRLTDQRIGALPIEDLRRLLDAQLQESIPAAG